MTAQQRELLDRLFAEAVTMLPEQRAQWLTGSCQDPQVRSELESLLAFAAAGPPRRVLEAIEHAAASLAGGTLIGQRVGQYRLTGQIGQGGMGTVYRAVRDDDEFRQTVAIKMLRFAQGGPLELQRFRRERQILASLEHPYIARLLDGGAWVPPGTSGSQPYIVMEYVEGLPLTTYCEESKLSVRQRLLLFRQVCDALSYAHRRLVVHRDIKPGNILATPDGTPKLLDFGIAKLLDVETEDASTQTVAGMAAMTPDYASPEQVRGEPVSTVTDVYSLGAVLYEMLTGQRAQRLVAYDPVEIVREICDREVRPPSVTGGRQLRGDLDVIVLKAMQKEPARRYNSVDQFSEDIRRYLEGLPIVARPDARAYRAAKFVRRHSLALAGIGAVFVALTGGIAASTWEAIRTGRAERSALTERDRAATAEAAAKRERDHALTAEQTTAGERNKAVAAKQRADDESAIAAAVNEFLRNDLLAQAGASAQAQPGTKPDPDLKVRTALDRAAARIAGKFAGQPLVEASIRQTIGRAYLDLGLMSEAKGQMEHALVLRRHALGEEHPLTLNTMKDLWEVTWLREGNYAQAVVVFTRLLEVDRRVLGEEHPETLGTMDDLATAYDEEGKHTQAEALYIKVLASRRRVLGEEHPDTLMSMNNLAVLYADEGKHMQARALNTTVLSARRRSLGEEHPATLQSMNTLAALYLREGNYPQAEPLIARLADVQIRTLGEKHPETQSTTNNLGMLYLYEGKFTQAEPLFAKLLEAQRMHGDEDPDALRTMSNLALVYRAEGDYTRAEALLTSLLAVRRRALGDQHPNTLITTTNLATVYRGQGRFDEAEALYTRAVEGQRRASGEEHPATLAAMDNLAALYRVQHKYTQAEALFAKTLEARSRVPGETHPDTINTLASLGETRLQDRKYAEAEPLLRAARSGYEKTGTDTWRRYYNQSALGASLAGQKNYSEAEPLLLTGYRGMFQLRTTMPAENQPALEQVRQWLVGLYQDWGKPESAAEWRAKLQAPPDGAPKP